MSTNSIYRNNLIARFLDYQTERFSDKEKFFEQILKSGTRPPVFLKSTANYNVLFEPGTDSKKIKKILDEIPVRSRHRWFQSMNSSQALAQSIFGNLKIYVRVNLLNGLQDDLRNPVFGTADLTFQNITMEHNIDLLGEPRSTSVDVFISGEYQISTE